MVFFTRSRDQNRSGISRLFQPRNPDGTPKAGDSTIHKHGHRRGEPKHADSYLPELREAGLWPPDRPAGLPALSERAILIFLLVSILLPF